MYKPVVLSNKDGGFDIFGIDGINESRADRGRISHRTTKMAAKEVCRQQTEAYAEALAENYDVTIKEVIKDAIDEARLPDNMIFMDFDVHKVVQEADISRPKSYNRKLRVFTEELYHPQRKERNASHQDYRDSVGWVPASEKKLPPKKVRVRRAHKPRPTADQLSWAKKLEEAVHVH